MKQLKPFAAIVASRKGKSFDEVTVTAVRAARAARYNHSPAYELICSDNNVRREVALDTKRNRILFNDIRKYHKEIDKLYDKIKNAEKQIKVITAYEVNHKP